MLTGPGKVDAVGIFSKVFVDDGVAFVVIAFADQPTENVMVIRRIRDSGGLVATVNG